MPRKLQSASPRVNRFSRRICARGGVATNIEAVATEIERDYLMEATGIVRRTEDIALDLLSKLSLLTFSPFRSVRSLLGSLFMVLLCLALCLKMQIKDSEPINEQTR